MLYTIFIRLKDTNICKVMHDSNIYFTTLRCSYLVCSMFEDASSSASSVLKRLCDKEHINTVVDDDIELNDMLESAGMVFVQSLKELGRYSSL